MAVSSLTNRVVLAGNGSSATFAFQNYFFSQNDLVVSLYDTLVGSSSLMVLNTNYSVVGSANTQGLYPNGANVVFINPIPSSTQNVVIDRNPAQVQNFSMSQTGSVSSTAINQQFDYLTLIIQHLQDQVSRCVQLPDGDGSNFISTLPQGMLQSGGYALSLNSTGSSFVWTQLLGGGATILSTAGGGTGTSTAPNAWGVIYGASNQTYSSTAAGQAGMVLVGQGSSGPIFTALNLAGPGLTGVMPISFGGTGQSNANAAFNALSPMTTWGDVIYCGSGVIATRLVAGTSGQFLQTGGPGANPVWAAAMANPMTLWGDTVFAGSGNVATRLAAGTSGQFLQTAGAGANPAWASPNFGSSALLVVNNLSDVASTAQAWKNISPGTAWGDFIFVGSGLIGTRLAAGSAGQVLTTQGNTSNPTWSSALVNPFTLLGDMIYAGSAAVTSRLAGTTSNSSCFLVQTGAAGVSAAPIWTPLAKSTQQIFTGSSSQTYTLPANCKWIEVEGVGGGGGSGGALSSAAAAAAGGGGAGGGYFYKLIINPAASYILTMGGAGTAGSSSSGTGGQGGTVVFGSSVLATALIALGGGGGTIGATSTTPTVSGAGSAGGTSSGGDINTTGGDGGVGIVLAATQNLSGYGGTSMFATSVRGSGNGNTAGTAGYNYGGGASGGFQINGGGAQTGSSGAVPMVRIKEYYV